MITTDERLDADALAELGWELKPEGLCRDEQCVPLPADADTSDGRVDTGLVAERLRRPMALDTATGLRALGPETDGGVLPSATLPDLELTDVDGNPFSLQALHGRRTLLVAWASW